MAGSYDEQVTIARIKTRQAEITRLLQGTFPADANGAYAKSKLLLESVQLSGALLDLFTEFAGNRETTLADVQVTIAGIANRRNLISVWLAVPYMVMTAAHRAALLDQAAALAKLQTRGELLLKYMREQTPTPAERALLPSSITNPQGVTLAQLDTMQRARNLKILAIASGIVGIFFLTYRSNAWTR